jgi:hypothetical protein
LVHAESLGPPSAVSPIPETPLGEAGESLKTAQALLGHSDLETTLNVYTHAIPESQKRAVDKVAAMLFADVHKISAAAENGKVNELESKDMKERWSRDPDLNRRPVDCSIYIMLLVLDVFSLTSHDGLAPYSAPIVRKLFADSLSELARDFEGIAGTRTDNRVAVLDSSSVWCGLEHFIGIGTRNIRRDHRS